MEFRKVSDLLTKNAAAYPDKEYLFYRDKVYTYKQALNAAILAANVLKAHGVKKGDRVAILLGNSTDFVLGYFAIQLLCAISVPTNVFFKDVEIAANLSDCTAEYLLTSEAFADRMDHIYELVPTLKTIFTFDKTSFESVVINEAPHNLANPDVPADPDDIATLLYTSGTTGCPKGVMLTQTNVLINAKQTRMRVGIEHDDRMLLVLPLFHATSFTCSCLAPHIEGGSIVILDSILETGKEYYPKLLADLKPSIMIGVPALFAAMCRVKDTENLREKMPFRLYASGGAPLPVEVINRFKELYGLPVIEGYGLSEASPACVFNPLDFQKVGTIGVAFPWVELKVVDENDNERPINMPGELVLRGPNVMKGYWNQPEETAKALRNGWLHTGDVATIDKDGFVTIVDRIKDLILVKGMNLYPREIEELLYKFNGVLSAALVGIPDGDGSEIPIAYVKLDPAENIDVKELQKYVKRNAATFKIPRRYVFTDDIPVNAGGKVQKTVLRERAIKEFGDTK